MTEQARTSERHAAVCLVATVEGGGRLSSGVCRSLILSLALAHARTHRSHQGFMSECSITERVHYSPSDHCSRRGVGTVEQSRARRHAAASKHTHTGSHSHTHTNNLGPSSSAAALQNSTGPQIDVPFLSGRRQQLYFSWVALNIYLNRGGPRPSRAEPSLAGRQSRGEVRGDCGNLNFMHSPRHLHSFIYFVALFSRKGLLCLNVPPIGAGNLSARLPEEEQLPLRANQVEGLLQLQCVK